MFFDLECAIHHEYAPQDKQLIRSTASVFFISWEMQYDENGYSYGQLVIGSFITTTYPLVQHIWCRIFSRNIKSPRWLSPLQLRFGTLQLLAFPKTKIIFEREEISDCWWGSWKYDGAADGDWENCVRSHGTYLEGDWGIIVLCIMFLVSCIFSTKCLYFSYYMAGYLLDRPSISSA